MKNTGIKKIIFNSEYNLQGDNPAEVERLAGYVDSLMQRINYESPNQSGETIAVVSALNIAESFFKEKDFHQEMTNNYSELIKDCNNQIEEVCRLIDQNL
jgi:cell division protein ZapA (FtsZ GTPase activity inhibitor)